MQFSSVVLPAPSPYQQFNLLNYMLLDFLMFYAVKTEDYTNTSHTIRVVKLDLMPYSMIES